MKESQYMGVHHDHLVGVLEGRRAEDKEASIFMDYKVRQTECLWNIRQLFAPLLHNLFTS